MECSMTRAKRPVGKLTERSFLLPTKRLRGWAKVNADLVGFEQNRRPQTEATLDMDATLVETHKQEALCSYKKYRAYHR